MMNYVLLLLTLLMFNLELYSQKMNVKVIKSKELLELKASGKLDNELTEKYHVSIYRLEGDRILVDFDNVGHIYPSVKNLIETYDEIYGEKSDRTYHILEGRFPYDQNFVAVYNEVAKEGLEKLGIKEFDYSLESLKHVDYALNQVLNDTYPLDDIYPGLVAIVGKVLINEVPGGNWIIFKSEDVEVWEPFIVDNKNRYYNPFLLVYKELFEYYLEELEQVALFDHVQIELLQYNIDVNGAN